MMEMDIRKFIGPAAERLNKNMRYAGYAGKMNVVATADSPHGFIGPYEMDLAHSQNKYSTKSCILILAVKISQYMQPGASR